MSQSKQVILLDFDPNDDIELIAVTPDPQEWLLHREVVKDRGDGIEFL